MKKNALFYNVITSPEVKKEHTLTKSMIFRPVVLVSVYHNVRTALEKPNK